MIIAAISILCNSFFEIKEWQPKPVLYWERESEDMVWSRRRREHRCLSILGILFKMVSFVVWEAWVRTVVLGYLVLCSPARDYAAQVAIASLFLAAVKLLLMLAKFCFPGLVRTDLLMDYDRTVQLFYKTVVVVAIVLILSHLLSYGWDWLQELTHSVISMIKQGLYHYLSEYLVTVASHCPSEQLNGYGSYENWLFLHKNPLFMGLAFATIARADIPEEEWIEKFQIAEGIRIEENGDYYRICIGRFHWKFLKDNDLDRQIFTVLLATARNKQGELVVTSRPLAQALGWSHHDLVGRLVRAWENSGNTFHGLLARVKNPYQSKLLKAVLVILRQDFSLTLLDIKSRLEGHGDQCVRQATIGQIKEVLKKITFEQIHDELRIYCAGQNQQQATTMFSNDDQVKVERSACSYRVVYGNLFWEVNRANRFGWAALMHTLLTARTHDNKRITSTRQLAAMMGLDYHQKLQIAIQRYRCIAKHFHNLGEFLPIEKIGVNDRLRRVILQMWIEDITLTGQQILRRINARADLPDISIEKVRSLMREVDFWEVRKALGRQYRKGKYRKSTEWVMDRYRRIIDDLISKLAQGKTWTPAEIDKYIGSLPAMIRPDSAQKQGGNGTPITNAWLKCFLFGLPRVIDNKPCCPKCGSFNTSPKSSLPKIHMIKDPETGQEQRVVTFRFRCKNHACPTQTFSAPLDDTHILEQARFAKACLMLRQVMLLRSPYRALADLLGTTKSIVFTELTYISQMADHWDEILGPVRFSGTVCIDEKFVKIADFKKTKKRPFAYLYLAVDPATNDLLHIEVFASRDKESAEAFLMQLKVKGIYPQTIMTDLTENYDQPARRVYGRSVTMARCFFHFKQNIFKHMHDQFGKKDVPQIAEDLKEAIFDVVDAKSKKTIKKRFDALIRAKDQYLQQEPKLESMFKCLESYYPHLMRVIENKRVPIRTNNPVELVIRHFNQRYKAMSGFKSLETARRHARLFQIVYRFTPLSNDIDDRSRRGLAPLELAGYQIRHMPIFQYLTAPLLFNIQPEKNLNLLHQHESGVA